MAIVPWTAAVVMPFPFDFGRKTENMPKRISEGTKQRGIRLVLDHLDECSNLNTACESVSKRLGFGAESLRWRARQAQIDGGDRDGVTTSGSERIRRLESENRELCEANAILRDAVVFFDGELDPDAADPSVR